VFWIALRCNARLIEAVTMAAARDSSSPYQPALPLPPPGLLIFRRI
jgi:hypothetical protein